MDSICWVSFTGIAAGTRIFQQLTRVGQNNLNVLWREGVEDRGQTNMGRNPAKVPDEEKR